MSNLFYSLVYEPIVYVPVALLLALLAGWLLVRGLRVPKALRTHALCGVCGYQLTILTTERCTECGTPILHAGIRTRRTTLKDRGSALGVAICWTILVLCGTLMLHAANVHVISTYTANPYPVTGVARYEPIPDPASSTGHRPGPDYILVVTLNGSAKWNTLGNQVSTRGTATLQLETSNGLTQPREVDITDPNAITPRLVREMILEANLDPQGPIIRYESDRWRELPLDWQANFYQAISWYQYRNPATMFGANAPRWMQQQTDPADPTLPPTAGIEMVSYEHDTTATAAMPRNWLAPISAYLGPMLGIIAGIVWLGGLIGLVILRLHLVRRPKMLTPPPPPALV